MAPLAMASPTYEGPKALGFSRYASPDTRKAQLTVASAVPNITPSAPDTTIATKQQIAAAESTREMVPPASFEMTPPAVELAVEQGNVLKEQVEEHTAKFSRAVSSAVINIRQLLSLLRESTPGSEVVDDLWQELEQLFEIANNAKAALPEFLEKQRNNMSLYHSSMMNETIRETQDELNLQHKKVNTQHNLILEQQDAFQHYKTQTASKLKDLKSLQERVSRLTLEKGNFRTEVNQYKELLEQETKRKTEDLEAADALQKELETLVASKKKLQDENQTLRRTTTDMLEQLNNTEQRVTDRFAKELQAKVEELQKETVKTTTLNTLIDNLKDVESTSKKELDKLKSENRLLSVKYTNQASEHAVAFKVGCFVFQT
jgi:DNA repair exonuclease SbcCD ATPase subunit